MEEYTKKDMEEAIEAIAVMIGRSEKAQEKFAEGTSQFTLQKNRIRALYIASALIARELAGGDVNDDYSQEDYEKAVAPIASLISKSRKAQQKVAQGSWQYTMLGNNLKALYIASLLLNREVDK